MHPVVFRLHRGLWPCPAGFNPAWLLRPLPTVGMPYGKSQRHVPAKTTVQVPRPKAERVGDPGRRQRSEAKPCGACPTGSAGKAARISCGRPGTVPCTPSSGHPWSPWTRTPCHPDGRRATGAWCRAPGRRRRARWLPSSPTRRALSSAGPRDCSPRTETSAFGSLAHPAPPPTLRPAAVSGKGACAHGDSYSAPAKPASRHLPAGREREAVAPLRPRPRAARPAPAPPARKWPVCPSARGG